MSVIGPRPALWNQYDLIAERDKYGANDVLPGLTGWAQINGRDELPISVKAAYDGEYVCNMSFAFDCRCFFGIIGRVLKNGGNIKSLAIDWRTPAEKAWEKNTKPPQKCSKRCSKPLWLTAAVKRNEPRSAPNILRAIAYVSGS